MKKLAEKISPFTKKLDVINESTGKLGEMVEKPETEDGNTQKPALESITCTQSLGDTLTLMKRSNNFFKLEEIIKWRCFLEWCFYSTNRQNRTNVKNEEYAITPNILKKFTSAKLTTYKRIKFS